MADQLVVQSPPLPFTTGGTGFGATLVAGAGATNGCEGVVATRGDGEAEIVVNWGLE
jgi:hypothetical protein